MKPEIGIGKRGSIRLRRRLTAHTRSTSKYIHKSGWRVCSCLRITSATAAPDSFNWIILNGVA